MNSNDGLNLTAREASDVVDQAHVRRIAHGDRQLTLDLEHGSHTVLAQERSGQDAKDAAIDQMAIETNEWHAVLNGKRLEQIVLRDEPHSQEYLPHALER